MNMKLTKSMYFQQDLISDTMFSFKVISNQAQFNALRKSISAASFSDAVKALMEDVMFLLFEDYVRRSPVRTGTFKRSWDCEQVSPTLVLIWSSDNRGKCIALEHGHSKQAPQGVVRISWIENQAKIEALKAKHLGMK